MIVLPELRVASGLGFIQNLSFGEADMIGAWGEAASGWGVHGMLQLSYEVFLGMFARVGYSMSYFSTTYEGTGCQDPQCTIPFGSAASDLFQMIDFNVGLRLN